MPGVEFFTSWISYLQSRANWGCEFIFSLIDRTMEYITSIWLGLLISAASWCYQCCFLSAEVCCWSYCSSFIFGSIQIRSLSPIWISVFFFFFFQKLNSCTFPLVLDLWRPGGSISCTCYNRYWWDSNWGPSRYNHAEPLWPSRAMQLLIATLNCIK